MCPGQMPRRSSRLGHMQEKMNVSNASIDFFWEADDEEDVPALKAVSLASLSLCDSAASAVQEGPYRVRFSANIDCKPCIHVMDYTQDEIEGCFYSREARAVMAASREDIIDKIDNGVNDEDEGELLRGLEYWCVESSTEIDQRVDAVVELVMDEQDDQIDENIFDEYTLSMAAQYVTSESSEVARQMAAQDAKLAQEAYIEMIHNGSIGNYIMPSSLSTYEPTKQKRKSRRRSSSKRKIADDAASETSLARKEDKKSKKKKVKSDKKAREKRRSSCAIYKERKEKKQRRSSDETVKSTKSSKSSKSSSSKSSKSSKRSKRKSSKSKKEKVPNKKTSSDTTVTTATTEPETIKPATEHSLSSDEEDTFLELSKKLSKNKSLNKPGRRNTLSGAPPATRNYLSEDDEPTARRSSWWDV